MVSTGDEIGPEEIWQEPVSRLCRRYETATGAEQPLDIDMRRTFEMTLGTLGAQGFRTLGIASRWWMPVMRPRRSATSAISFSPASPSSLIRRKQARGRRSRRCRPPGVSVKVLTGDNELVARHVFAEIGVPVTGVLTGDALTHLDATRR